MHIGSVFLMPTKFFSPEKGKTKATYCKLYSIFKTMDLRCDLYSILKTMDLIMVQVRVRAVCDIQGIKLGSAAVMLQGGWGMAGRREENQQWGNARPSWSLFRVHLCSRGKLERKLSAIVLCKQGPSVKPRTGGEFVCGFLLHQVPFKPTEKLGNNSI